MKRRWYVLHVKPRTEKKTEERLKLYRLWHHLPVYRKITRVQRRKVVRELPLFPGYVFACMNADERLRMLQTNLIVRTIDVPKQRELIHQLRQIAKAKKNGAEMRTVEKFTVGDYVRVVQGPFYGVEGYIKRDEGKATIVLNIEILGQAVSVSITPDCCEKIER
jgi:transcription antitermination factor NusG